MRILYVGSLRPWGTCSARLKALAQLGHQVVPLDADMFLRGYPNLVQRIIKNFPAGPAVVAYNRALLDAVAEVRPEVVWVDKGVFAKADILADMKSIYRPLLVHYNTDDVRFRPYQWRYLLPSVPVYDVHFTTNHWNVQDLKDLGARAVFKAEFGYDPDLHRRPSGDAGVSQARFPVVFIGHWEPTTEEAIISLIQADLSPRVWGENWFKSHHRRSLKSVVSDRPVWGPAYVQTIWNSDVCLCFLSKWNRSDVTVRSFEIPACGAFLLAERTDAHLEIYREGAEAEFFGCSDELVDKTKHYLANADNRAEVARNGYRRCVSSGYTWHDRMARMIEVLG